MIYTLTTNPAIDMNVNSGVPSYTHVNRTTDAVYTPNGKGLNVSFTLAHYGVKSTILGFFGGFSGNYSVEEASKICAVKPARKRSAGRGAFNGLRGRFNAGKFYVNLAR